LRYIDHSHPSDHHGEEALMPDFRERAADVPTINLAGSLVTLGPDWEAEDAYWQSAYPERPYARADRGYEYYRSAYQFGVDRAMEWRGRDWNDAERELEQRWSASTETSGSWEEMRDAVRDAWDHVRGSSQDDRTHIR